MGNRRRTARLSRAMAAFCLAVTVSAARAQDVEPLTRSESTTDHATTALGGKQTLPPPRGGEATPPARDPSRWDRLSGSLRRIRSKTNTKSSSGPGEEAVTTRREGQVRVRPGAEFPEFSPMETDSSVSPTKHEVTQEAPPPVTLPPFREMARRRRDFPVPRAAGIDSASVVPPLDPLPTPTAEQPGEYGIGEAAAEAALADSTTGQSEREPYGLGKRFLRGYPTLVLWFPRHLGPPRESDSAARERGISRRRTVRRRRL